MSGLSVSLPGAAPQLLRLFRGGAWDQDRPVESSQWRSFFEVSCSSSRFYVLLHNMCVSVFSIQIRVFLPCQALLLQLPPQEDMAGLFCYSGKNVFCHKEHGARSLTTWYFRLMWF